MSRSLPPLPEPAILHAIGWYGTSPGFEQRFALFLESVDRAQRDGVTHLALASTPDGWSHPGWQVLPVERDARSLGDTRPKPFLRDILDAALERALPHDWLLFTNSDLGLVPDVYARLRRMRASAVEYMRRDVDGDPCTLDQLLSGPGEPYEIGLDGFALRACLYAEVREVLPDLVIGEPHWDASLSGILRRLVPVRRDAASAYHPRHPQAWSIADPTPAGRHNEALFLDALVLGNVPTYLVAGGPERTDTAVVVTSYASDAIRAEANVEGVRRQLRQDLFADVFLVELLLEGEESRFPADVLSQVRHLVLRGDDACLDLFQKEALQNLGWRAALAEGGYDYFLFTDADVFATDLDWWSRIRARLRDDPTRVVQGFRVVTDPADAGFDRTSVGATFVLGHQTDLLLNPGIAWGLHRCLLEQAGGFNPFCIEGGGDSAFVAECVNGPDELYDPWLLDFRWFDEIIRDIPVRAGIDCVAVDIIHVNHGPASERNYQQVRYAIDGFPPITELVELGDDGLLRWRDPSCPERALLQRRAEMRTPAEVDRLFAEHGYSRSDPKPVERRPPRPKPPPVVASAVAPRLVSPVAEEAGSGLPIFDPHEIFRGEWPFSWADNVEGQNGTTYAPIAPDRDPPTLALRRLSDERSIVVALAVRPTWLTVDLGEYDALRLTVRTEGGSDPEIAVWLTAHAENGADSESEHLALSARGLRAEAAQRFSIQLTDLVGQSGFDLSRTRQVVVVAQRCELLELSQIVVERPVDTGVARTDGSRSGRGSFGGRATPGRVRIDSGTVVSDRGAPLRGVPIWIYGWGSQNRLNDHASDHRFYERLSGLGLNAVRLVCFDAWQRSNGFPYYAFDVEGPERTRFLQELDTAVELATRAGLHVLVDYHDVGTLDTEHCRAFWRLIAGRYADCPNVLYELANEPVAWFADDWDDRALAAQQELLGTMRSRAPDTHIVLCSFANTSGGQRSMVDVAGALEVDWSKASVGFHCYGTGGTSAAIVEARERFPVLCTEVDVPLARGGDPHVVAMDGDEWSTATLERLGVSWFAWRCNGPAELQEFYVDGFLADARRRGYDWMSDG